MTQNYFYERMKEECFIRVCKITIKGMGKILITTQKSTDTN